MKRRIELDYTLGEGWLAPWLDGLREGQAIASVCETCDEAQFPPLRNCPNCRTPSSGWRKLEGGAALVFRTVGTDGDFVLARFDGASSAAIARADGLPQDATRAVIAPSPGDVPVITLKSEPKS